MGIIWNVGSWLIAVAIPLSGGIFGAGTTASQVRGWYSKLTKPWWTPPNWLFGPAWTTLYTLMGTASWMVWKRGGFVAQSRPLAIYGASLIANFAWTPLFFGMHRMDLAFADILAMLALEAATVQSFSRVIGSKAALLTLGPLMVWTSYATALNFNLMRTNPPGAAEAASAIDAGAASGTETSDKTQ